MYKLVNILCFKHMPQITYAWGMMLTGYFLKSWTFTLTHEFAMINNMKLGKAYERGSR
jgi:hypothetical protein